MQHYTIRPVLWEHKMNAQGLCPLKICITIDRKRAYRKTPYKLKPVQFKEEKVVGLHNAETINAFIRDEKKRIEDELYDQSRGKTITIEELQYNKTGISFEEYAKLIRYDKTRVNRILAFKPGLRVIQLNLDFLRALEAHERKRKSHPNTIHSTFKYLAQILRAAKREKIISENPIELKQFKLPKYVNPEKDFLTSTELDKLWKLLKKDLPGNTHATLVYFLLACYTGLRHSDWAGFNASKMCKDGLIRLRAHKNKRDVVIPIGPSLKKIIPLTKDLPPALSNQKCNTHLKAIAVMAELDNKELTCHTARHTAGNLFAKNGLNISIVAALLAIKETTAQVYFHLSGSDITKQAAILRKI